jgi:hypothetical protein
MYRDQYPIRVSQQEAIARVRALTDYWDATYRTRTEWSGNRGVISGRVLGLSFWARFTVDEDRLHGELKVSSLAVRMGGRGYLKRKLDDYLDPDHSLEDLRSRVPDLAAARA